MPDCSIPRPGSKPTTGRATLTPLLREQPIAPAAAEDLKRRWKKLLKTGAQLDALAAQRRHKMRIQAKKLRYAAEFFAGALQEGRTATEGLRGARL
jgi:CHAD domain-containing protein